MEPEISLPPSQQPATCPYPKRNKSGPVHTIVFIYDPFQYYPPIYVMIYKVLSLFSGFPNKTLYAFLCSPIRITWSIDIARHHVVTTDCRKLQSTSACGVGVTSSGITLLRSFVLRSDSWFKMLNWEIGDYIVFMLSLSFIFFLSFSLSSGN